MSKKLPGKNSPPQPDREEIKRKIEHAKEHGEPISIRGISEKLKEKEEPKEKPRLPEDPTKAANPIKEADNKPLVLQKWYWTRKWGADEHDANLLVKLSKMDLEDGKQVNEELYITLANDRREELGLPKYYENPNWQNERHPLEIEREKEALSMDRADILWKQFVKDIEQLIIVLDKISAVFDLFVFSMDEIPEAFKYINDPELGGGWFVLKVLFKHIIDGDYDETTYDILKTFGEENRQKMRNFLLTLIEELKL